MGLGIAGDRHVGWERGCFYKTISRMDLHGTRAEQVKQVGNAVCPPVAKALCETIAEAA